MERKAGKQKGDPGSNLAQVTDPDEIVVHAPRRCVDCNYDLGDAPVVEIERRQVFDVPPMSVVVTEHQSERRQCRCGTTTAAGFPDEVTAPALYGSRLRALATYLIVFQHIPYDKTRQLFSDILGVELSAGTIVGAMRHGAAGLDGFREAVREHLRGSDVVHFDETGLRVAGKLHWTHSASTEHLTDYFVHRRRGRKAIDKGEVLPSFSGVAVHDGWKAYRKYKAAHGLCNAHHLRELIAASELPGQDWADKMIDLLVDTKDHVDQAVEAGKSSLDDQVLRGIERSYDRLIRQGWKANPEQPTKKQTKTFNLLVRLDDYQDDVLRFAHDFRVPFDNNLAERDIRMAKLQQKISGCFRTLRGAQNYLLIRSYISTARKQGQNALDVLCSLFEGEPWMPAAFVT